eukprot:3584029-Pyramimonas_sp.AAC.1
MTSRQRRSMTMRVALDAVVHPTVNKTYQVRRAAARLVFKQVIDKISAQTAVRASAESGFVDQARGFNGDYIDKFTEWFREQAEANLDILLAPPP